MLVRSNSSSVRGQRVETADQMDGSAVLHELGAHLFVGLPMSEEGIPRVSCDEAWIPDVELDQSSTRQGERQDTIEDVARSCPLEPIRQESVVERSITSGRNKIIEPLSEG